MKRLLCLTAAFGCAATAAFAQHMDIPMAQQLGAQVYLRPAKGSTAEAASLVESINRALDKSRLVHLVPFTTDETMEVEAPLSMVTDSKGRLTVTYEVTPPHGGVGRTYSTNCPPVQLDRCADAIAQRVERLAREIEADGRNPAAG